MKSSSVQTSETTVATKQPAFSGDLPRQHYWNRLLAPACVLVLIALYQWPILSGRYSFLDVGPDIVNMAVPDLDLRAHALRSHVLPVWDPYESGGQPMLAEVTAGLLDPFSYLLLLMPLHNGHIPLSFVQAYFALLHCFAGLAAYLLARELKVRRSAAVIAGVFYAIGGVPGNSIWIQFITEAIYPPLALIFLIRSLQGKRPIANSALAGLLIGLSWFSGTHHIPLVATLSFGAVLVAFIFNEHWRLGLLRALAFGSALVCISAPQILPALQYTQFSTRWVGLKNPMIGAVKVPFQAHLGAENVRPSELLGIIFPVDFSFWGAGIVFAGIVAVVLAIYALYRFPNSRIVRLCVALVIAGILMTLSQHNIFYGVFYLVIPMFDKLRESTVWIYITHLGLTCLVALGVDLFFSRQESWFYQRTVRVLFPLGAALLTISYVLRFWAPQRDAELNRLATSGLVALLLAALVFVFDRRLMKSGLVAALLVMLLMIEHGNVSSLGGRIYYPRNNEWPSRFEQPLRATEPTATFLRSRGDVERIDVNRSDVPMNFGDYHRIEEMSSHGASMLTSIFLMRFWEPRVRQLYGVNYYVARTPSQPDQVDIFTAPSGIKVFRNPNARPRVWSVHHLVSTKGYTEGRTLLSQPSFDLSTTAFVEGTLPQLERCDPSDRVELLNRGWFSSTIRATMACKGMVVLNDNWYPGWRAYVDGRTAAIYEPYMTIRGVVVDAGTHIIQMHYRPRAFYLGLLLFAVGIAGTILLFRRVEVAAVNLLE